MLGRITTWIFYALVFFLLGVWASPRLPALSNMTGSLANYGSSAWSTVWKGKSNSSPQAPATPKPSLDYDQGLAQARADNQRGDVTSSVQRYRSLISAYPEKTDARGELGNVLYQSGQLGEAAQVFFDLATHELDRGNANLARMLEPPIRRGNPVLADEIKSRLGSTGLQ